MSVCIHERPRIDRSAGLGDPLTETLQEADLVLPVLENTGLIDPSDHDMVKGAGSI